jgi:hypothetical protein
MRQNLATHVHVLTNAKVQSWVNGAHGQCAARHAASVRSLAAESTRMFLQAAASRMAETQKHFNAMFKNAAKIARSALGLIGAIVNGP